MDQVARYETSDSTWKVLAIDPVTGIVTGYATLALLNAAGARAFPAFDPGVYAGNLLIQVEDSSDSAVAGAGAYYAINRQDAGFGSLGSDEARDDVATPLPTGVIVTWPGAGVIFPVLVTNVWCRKVTAANEMVFTAIVG